MTQNTILCDTHLTLGAKMTDFCGWNMPVQYSGIIDEHNTVRTCAGLFDVSHMGELFVSGCDALAFLQKLLPQDLSKLDEGKAQYCQLLNEKGGLIDDLIVYRLCEDSFLVIMNASRITQDMEWFLAHKKSFDVSLEDKSDKYSMLALQGPRSSEVLEKIGLGPEKHPSFFTISQTKINDIPLFLARTGYTGEDGFELIFENEFAIPLWEMLMDAGEEFGMKPIGLGARDTLRLEAGLMLYGNDLDEKTSPLEAGLKWSVSCDKCDDYVAKSIILDQHKNGTEKKLIGFEMIERAIPRHEYEIYRDGKRIGVVTSGGYSPTLNKNIGMGYVETSENIMLDSTIQIMVRNKLYNAKVVKRPFVEKRYRH